MENYPNPMLFSVLNKVFSVKAPSVDPVAKKEGEIVCDQSDVFNIYIIHL